MASYRSSRGPMPGQATLDAFLDAARRQPRPLPLVGHVRHDNQIPGALYIGRKFGQIPESKYGNPYRMPEDGDRAEVIRKFTLVAREMLRQDPHWLDEARRASVLTCWCRRVGESRPACHGDAIVALLRELDEFPPAGRPAGASALAGPASAAGCGPYRFGRFGRRRRPAFSASRRSTSVAS